MQFISGLPLAPSFPNEMFPKAAVTHSGEQKRAEKVQEQEEDILKCHNKLKENECFYAREIARSALQLNAVKSDKRQQDKGIQMNHHHHRWGRGS